MNRSVKTHELKRKGYVTQTLCAFYFWRECLYNSKVCWQDRINAVPKGQPAFRTLNQTPRTNPSQKQPLFNNLVKENSVRANLVYGHLDASYQILAVISIGNLALCASHGL